MYKYRLFAYPVVVWLTIKSRRLDLEGGACWLHDGHAEIKVEALGLGDEAMGECMRGSVRPFPAVNFNVPALLNPIV